MDQKMSPRALQLRWALLLALALLLPDPVRATGRPYEIGGAQSELGRIHELAERLSKQNLFYQLHLADLRKQDLYDTAAEIDRALELLQKGSAIYTVAAPPSPAIREQIDRVDKTWGPLRRMALASPYDYLRRASEFMPRQQRLGDPLLLRTFDRMSQALIGEADRLMALYHEECLKTGYELCELATSYGRPIMLAERIVKDVVFVQAGLDVESREGLLRESRDALDAHIAKITKAPVLLDAMEPSRGDSGAFTSGLWRSLTEDWGRLRLEVELAISGRAEEIDLKRVMKIQSRLVENWERFTVAMVRYVNALSED